MRELINPPGTEELYATWRFSQAVKVGQTVWVSGQVGVDEKGGAVGEGIEEQTRAALRNLERVLGAAGASLADVVELTSFHVSMEEMPGFASVKNEFFKENYPAWTAVGVTALALPELRIEVKACAVIGDASP